MARRVTKRPNEGSVISVTDDHERPLASLNDLPTDVRSDFDYVDQQDADSLRFVRYRGEWYDVNDTEGLAPDSLKSQGWSVYLSESYWSGVVFRHFDREGNYMAETVVCGHYWIEDSHD